MERENYYILLDLSVDPPETDPDVIRNAIQTKKIEWSRLRNHPTKGLQIQKYINMIPDIQQVMLDAALRQKEAAEAVHILQSGKETKITEIDGHIDILMGKGFISKEDIIRLAEIHGLDQSEINARIIARQNEKYARVDRLISLKMGKGYLLEEEVAKIARKNALDPSEIRKRIRCPIVKNEGEAEGIKIQSLDKSLEKTITDNLKVVGKSSLYDFLSALETAEIEELQEKASRKKKDLASLGKKDAVVTAGITLAGQCLTIFKTPESRLAYDVSRASAKLTALESDINVAAINKKIRHEYFDALITKAMAYGMDREEAAGYIQDYCAKKNYQIERKPKGKRRTLLIAAAAGIALALIAGGALTWSGFHHKALRKTEYRNLLTRVEAEKDPGQKIALLKKYAAAHPGGEYTEEADQRIKTIESNASAQTLQNILSKVQELVDAGRLADSRALLLREAETTKNSDNAKAIRAKLQQISALMDERDFERLSAVALTGEADQKIQLFQEYMKNHPEGKYRDEVQSFINGMSDEYFIYLTKKLSRCEASAQWEDCERLCQSYIDLYDNSHSDQLKQMLTAYQQNLREEKIFAALTAKARAAEPDYAAAIQIYRDYLAAYPDTSVSEKVNGEIDRLNQEIAAQNIVRASNALRLRLAETQGRFVEEKSGVVRDTKTGLMWCLTDSAITRPGSCLTYEEAQSYATALTTGGFSDWRLPTPEELAEIYQSEIPFPSEGKRTYWTSDSYSGYSDGWQTHVTTLSTETGRQWEKTRKNALECGAVRAVRNP